MLNREILEELVSGLCDIFRDNIFQIILYGSVARNEATTESDIDKSNMEKWGDVLPFYRNIREEGIVLWKAA